MGILVLRSGKNNIEIWDLIEIFQQSICKKLPLFTNIVGFERCALGVVYKLISGEIHTNLGDERQNTNW